MLLHGARAEQPTSKTVRCFAKLITVQRGINKLQFVGLIENKINTYIVGADALHPPVLCELRGTMWASYPTNQLYISGR